MGDVDAFEGDRARVGVDEAEDSLGKLGLAVALNAGDGNDLAPFDVETDVIEDCVAGGAQERNLVEA
ncbi:Uncharacterised protein [Chlamydia trachomatis]|nr:Uncharacterised protein [Chlamydia trachomatis]